MSRKYNQYKTVFRILNKAGAIMVDVNETIEGLAFLAPLSESLSADLMFNKLIAPSENGWVIVNKSLKRAIDKEISFKSQEPKRVKLTQSNDLHQPLQLFLKRTAKIDRPGPVAQFLLTVFNDRNNGQAWKDDALRFKACDDGRFKTLMDELRANGLITFSNSEILWFCTPTTKLSKYLQPRANRVSKTKKVLKMSPDIETQEKLTLALKQIEQLQNTIEFLGKVVSMKEKEQEKRELEYEIVLGHRLPQREQQIFTWPRSYTPSKGCLDVVVKMTPAHSEKDNHTFLAIKIAKNKPSEYTTIVTSNANFDAENYKSWRHWAPCTEDMIKQYMGALAPKLVEIKEEATVCT